METFENCDMTNNADNFKVQLAAILKKYDMTDLLSVLNEVKVVVKENLLDAWLCARPMDAEKFSEDDELKQLVLSSSGKWLEPTKSYPEFTIILADKDKTDTGLILTAVHELQHVADFINSIKCTQQISAEQIDSIPAPHIGFVGWSEFKAAYSEIMLELRMKQTENDKDMFRIQAGILGYRTADALEGIIWARVRKDEREVYYYIARYLGAQRAVRNFSRAGAAFQLWHLTPTTITENFGWVFYLANTWEEMETHDLYDSREVDSLLLKIHESILKLYNKS